MFGYKDLIRTRSPLNGKIRVYSIFNQPRIEIGGLLQSGSLIRDIWKKACRIIKKSHIEPKKALLLGVAGGTVIEELVKKWPDIKVLGVEIDPIMVDLGRRFFQLSKYEKKGNLKIVVDDAFKQLDRLQDQKSRFDLILYDLYLGEKFITPKTRHKMIKQFYGILNKDGMVIVNQLFYDKHRLHAQEFIDDLNQEFNRIQLARVLVNLLVFARK